MKHDRPHCFKSSARSRPEMPYPHFTALQAKQDKHYRCHLKDKDRLLPFLEILGKKFGIRRFKHPYLFGAVFHTRTAVYAFCRIGHFLMPRFYGSCRTHGRTDAAMCAQVGIGDQSRFLHGSVFQLRLHDTSNETCIRCHRPVGTRQ